MTDVSYKIQNINCEHCSHTIKMELLELKGVKTVEVDVKTKIVTVSFELPATLSKIEELLTEINYPVEKSQV